MRRRLHADIPWEYRHGGLAANLALSRLQPTRIPGCDDCGVSLEDRGAALEDRCRDCEARDPVSFLRDAGVRLCR
jgi:tRNA(Ile2) C34 agmatinyltransferase TiaS